jgi:nucleotide-binding universal stress UspA family protein
MYKTVLVPVALDHRDGATRALAVARALQDAGGRLILLHVVEEIPGYAKTYLPEGTLAKAETEAKAALRALLSESGATGEPLVVSGHASSTILDIAEREGVDLIVMASHRPGLSDYLLGSTAARVVRHAPSSVHVLR